MDSIRTTLFDSLPSFYFIIMAIAFLFSLLSAFILKRRFKNHLFILFLFFMMMNISLPLAGLLINVWIVYYLMAVKYKKPLDETKRIDMLEYYSQFPKINRIFGESSMEQMLGDEINTTSQKMKALVALSEDTRKNEIILIRNTLSDSNDEIRLFSFALIDRLERGVNAKIHQALEQYAKADNREIRARIAGELAHSYWELLYYELVDEDLKFFIAKEIKKYAKEKLSFEPDDYQINVLLGKCSLVLQEFSESKYYLEKVLTEQPKKSEYLVPYLGEIYFAERNYGKVKKLMMQASSLRINMMLNPVVELWSPGVTDENK